MIDRLKKIASVEKISHAYILEGDKNSNKMSKAKDFAKEILRHEINAANKIDNGNYEDLIFIQADGLSVKDEAIEEMQNRLKNKPINNRNIVIIDNADTMTLRAQNRILKTLEEPAKGTVIMLLSENIENLQQTIRSRCVNFRITSEAEDFSYEYFQEAIKIENMIYNRAPIYEMFNSISDYAGNKESALTLLDKMEKWFGTICLYLYVPERYNKIDEDIKKELKQKSRVYKKEEIFRYVSSIEEAKQEIQRNISIAYTLKSLILKIGG